MDIEVPKMVTSSVHSIRQKFEISKLILKITNSYSQLQVPRYDLYRFKWHRKLG